jgi:putative endonuclease
MKRFFHVYILVSEKDETVHYTGVTQNVRERLRYHNRGACSHSSKYRPWRLETAIAFSSETKAHAFERYLKSGSGREFARRHF